VVSAVKQMKTVMLNNTDDLMDKGDFKVVPNPTTHYYSETAAWPAAEIQTHNTYLPIPELEIRLNGAIDFSDQNTGY